MTIKCINVINVFFCFVCVSHFQLVLNDRTIPITTGSAGGVNVANSAHPCVESPCANGGTCRPKWDSYECDCPLGYDGRHCQKGQLHIYVYILLREKNTFKCFRLSETLESEKLQKVTSYIFFCSYIILYFKRLNNAFVFVWYVALSVCWDDCACVMSISNHHGISNNMT